MKRVAIPVALVIPILVSIYFFAHLAMHADPWFNDYLIYHREGALFWEGTNPITTSGAGAFPWTYVMNVWLIPPFLSEQAGQIWTTVVLWGIFIGFIVWIAKRMRSFECSVWMKWVYASMIVFSLFPWVTTLAYGNIGAICCMFGVLSIYYMKRNRWVSGVFLALALMKPHATGLLALVFLGGVEPLRCV